MQRSTLQSYGDAALINAQELITEAELLCEHGHYARAYFLAVAAIEEIGKFFITFDAQGRNLADPAVTNKISKSLCDHPSKIRSAFTGFLTADPRKNAEAGVKLIIALQQGREPAMYTDINNDSSIHVPKVAVRPKAAQDCVRFANNCLQSAKNHLKEHNPVKRTLAEDQVFAMKPSQYKAIMGRSDFWWYYIAKKEAGEMELAEAILAFRSEYFLKDLVFQHDGGLP